jgi:hypothetical protein
MSSLDICGRIAVGLDANRARRNGQPGGGNLGQKSFDGWHAIRDVTAPSDRRLGSYGTALNTIVPPPDSVSTSSLSLIA